MATHRPFRVTAALLAASFLVSAVFVRAGGGAAQETVRLAEGTSVALATPHFIQTGKRYAFTWPGGGPAQTYIVKLVRPDGWVLVDVAEENVDPSFLVPGQTPTRWLHVGLAISVQEMRPLPY
jgi:hypothetical protein